MGVVKRSVHLVILSVLLVFSDIASSHGLADWVNAALHNTSAVVSQSPDQRSTDSLSGELLWPYLPKLSMSSESDIQVPDRLPDREDNDRVSLAVEQPLWNGDSHDTPPTAKSRATMRRIQSAQYRLEQALGIVSCYRQWHQATLSRQLWETQVSEAQVLIQHLKRTTQPLSGVLAPIKRTLQATQNKALIATVQQKRARISLEQLIGEPIHRKALLAHSERIKPIDKSLADLEKSALSNNPKIQLAKLNRDNANADMQSPETGLWSALSLRFEQDYNLQEDNSEDHNSQDHNSQDHVDSLGDSRFYLNLKGKLGSDFSHIDRARQAQGQQNTASEAVDKAINQLKTRIHTLYNHYRLSKQHITKLQSDVNTAKAVYQRSHQHCVRENSDCLKTLHHLDTLTKNRIALIQAQDQALSSGWQLYILSDGMNRDKHHL